MPDPEVAIENPNSRPQRRRRRWPWVLLGLFLLLVGGLVWLNGPGLRIFAPRIAKNFLEKAGMKGDFKVEGSLTGGLSVSDLTLESDGALKKLTIGEVTPHYHLRGLAKGKLDGLTVDGVQVDLRLGLEKKEDEKKPPLDLKALVETIRSVRGQVMPLKIDLKNLTLNATKEGESQFQLGSSSLHHEAGSPEISLDLGTITDPTGRQWEARESTIMWNEDDLVIARLDPLPGVGLRDLVMKLPAGGEPSADLRLLLDDAVFMVTTSPGFKAVQIDLREGKLQVDEAVKRFGIALPAKATLISLAVDVADVMPDPKAATGTLRVSLDDIVYQNWSLPELSLDAELGAGRGSVVARGVLLGTAVSLDAAVPVTREETRFVLGNATGKFAIDDVPALLRELAPRVAAIDPDAPVPPSSVDGDFTLAFSNNRPTSVDAALTLQPKNPTLVSPIALKGRWAPDEPVTAEAVIDGLKLAATYQIKPHAYQGTLALDGFTNTRIDRWLSIAKVQAPGVATVTGSWTGSGEIKTGVHRGELVLREATWSRPEAEPITVIGGLKYDWPNGFNTDGLRVRMADQSVALEAGLSNHLLELRRFVWTDGEQELAEGTAKLPVPEDFSKWKEMLANDTRSVEVDINSRLLTMGMLKQWVPTLEQLDPAATVQLGLHVSGTYPEPVVNATLQARDLRSPSQPKLPPADLKLELAASNGRMVVTGLATAPDFAPAELNAAIPFRPADWAKTPELIQQEPIEAEVNLPRIDISRFGSLVPNAEKVAGVVTGNVKVAGTVGKPEILGTLDLTGAEVRFKQDKFPAVENAAAAVEFAFDRVTLKTLKATVAGGTLSGGGSLAINQSKPGDLDFQLRGRQLPVVRNDFLILRSNLDLRLQGAWETAVISGTVGAVDGIFYRDIEILPIGAPFTGPAAAALPKVDTPKPPGSSIPEPFVNWGLDVTVRMETPFLIRGNLATGELTGSVKVGGTVGTPAPNGAFKLRKFKARLPFSTLEVANGSVIFKPETGFDPILEIRGTAEPRPYKVTIYAYGPASNPQLVLTSNPPLPENEIMTLLATGTTTAGLEDPQAASSRALQLLAEELRRGRFRFGKQLRPVLALLDRVDFSLSEADPYSSDAFSTATIELTDHWYVSAGVGATGDSRFLAIWRLSFR